MSSLGTFSFHLKQQTCLVIAQETKQPTHKQLQGLPPRTKAQFMATKAWTERKIKNSLLTFNGPHESAAEFNQLAYVAHKTLTHRCV